MNKFLIPLVILVFTIIPSAVPEAFADTRYSDSSFVITGLVNGCAYQSGVWNIMGYSSSLPTIYPDYPSFTYKFELYRTGQVFTGPTYSTSFTSTESTGTTTFKTHTLGEYTVYLKATSSYGSFDEIASNSGAVLILIVDSLTSDLEGTGYSWCTTTSVPGVELSITKPMDGCVFLASSDLNVDIFTNLNTRYPPYYFDYSITGTLLSNPLDIRYSLTYFAAAANFEKYATDEWWIFSTPHNAGEYVFTLKAIEVNNSLPPFISEPVNIMIVSSTSDSLVGSTGIIYDWCEDASGVTSVSYSSHHEAAEKNGGGSSDNKWQTSPTSGMNWVSTPMLIVEDGFTMNGKSWNITDNWHTNMTLQKIKTGESNDFKIKTFAQNGGLMWQQLAFGIEEIGKFNEAETTIVVYYNWDKSIEKVIIEQDTEIISETSLIVTTMQVDCRANNDAQCYETNIQVVFLEPLKDDIIAIHAADMDRRTMWAHYLNDGVDVYGELKHPPDTRTIPGPEKYEGLITVTQTEKYSTLWIDDKDRIYDKNEWDTFTWINQVFERFQDTGEPRTRLHSGFADKVLQEAIRAEMIYN